MILGLDISTSVTGYTLLDQKSRIILCEAWDFRNKRLFPDLYSKALHLKNELETIKGYGTIELVDIEEPFVLFKSGGATGKTVCTLVSIQWDVTWYFRVTV